MAKLVLITGGAKRLGKSMALYFADQGYDLLIHVNKSLVEGKSLITALEQTYPKQRFHLLCHDLTQWRSCENVFERLFNEKGMPDVLIHNASAYLKVNLEEVTDNQMEEMMAIHLYAPMIIGRVFRKLGGKGQIISMLDSAITKNVTSHGMYLVAKKALQNYTQMIALEWAPSIRVNAIALGPVLPPEKEEENYFHKVVEQTPLESRVLESSLHASLAYLIQNENVTGQTLFCDSGQHLM